MRMYQKIIYAECHGWKLCVHWWQVGGIINNCLLKVEGWEGVGVSVRDATGEG